MNKKKIALTICAVALTGVLAVGGSLAYFTDETKEVTNVFTSSNKELEGKILEEFDEEKAESFLPGDVIHKEPWLQNGSDSIDAWAAIKVDILVNDQAVSYNDFTSNYATVKYLQNQGFNLDNYELLQGDYNNSESLVFVYKDIVTPGMNTKPIFDKVDVNVGIKTVFSKEYSNKTIYEETDRQSDNSVQLDDGKWYILVDTTKAVYNSDKKYYLQDDNGLSEVSIDYVLPKLEITVQGYMIQAANVDYDTAKTELASFVGNNSDN